MSFLLILLFLRSFSHLGIVTTESLEYSLGVWKNGIPSSFSTFIDGFIGGPLVKLGQPTRRLLFEIDLKMQKSRFRFHCENIINMEMIPNFCGRVTLRSNEI